MARSRVFRMAKKRAVARVKRSMRVRQRRVRGKRIMRKMKSARRFGRTARRIKRLNNVSRGGFRL